MKIVSESNQRTFPIDSIRRSTNITYLSFSPFIYFRKRGVENFNQFLPLEFNFHSQPYVLFLALEFSPFPRNFAGSANFRYCKTQVVTKIASILPSFFCSPTFPFRFSRSRPAKKYSLSLLPYIARFHLNPAPYLLIAWMDTMNLNYLGQLFNR